MALRDNDIFLVNGGDPIVTVSTIPYNDRFFRTLNGVELVGLRFPTGWSYPGLQSIWQANSIVAYLSDADGNSISTATEGYLYILEYYSGTSEVKEIQINDTDRREYPTTNGYITIIEYDYSKSSKIYANQLLGSSNTEALLLVNEGPKSFRCPVGQLEQKNYKNKEGVDRILLVQRDGQSYQVTLKEFMDKYGDYARPGEEFHTDVSSGKLWTVPNGVRSISILAIGGGGGGGAAYFAGSGGGGGALSYRTNFEVRPGQKFRLYAGAGGAATSQNLGGIGGDGGDSWVEEVGGAVILSAGGGGGGQGSPYDLEGINPPPRGVSISGPFAGGKGGEGLVIAGTTRYKGGNGGFGAGKDYDTPGGGGAPGTYYKRGVSGRNSNGTGGLPAGTGGAAGGNNETRGRADGGGGIGMAGPSNTAFDYGNGGSGGQNQFRGSGGNFGGGGGGQASDRGKDELSGEGGQGAVRIIWPGTAPFP